MIFTEEVARLLAKKIHLQIPQILSSLETPPNPNMGDIAYPCFELSKEFKKNPAQIAVEIATELEPQLPIERIQSTGPYVNFFFNKALFAKDALSKKNHYPKRKEKIMVEHSNANTHKAAHIGHLRNMFLGDSLVRILRIVGYSVINHYYINDQGMHVAKCLWALQKFHAKEEPDGSRLSWLGKIYAEAHKESANEQNKKEIDEILQKLERHDPATMSLWKKTWQWSVDDWNNIFEKMKMLPFDAKLYESDIVGLEKPIVDNMLKKDILKESDGAIIADLEEFNLHTVILRKSDGTSPYIAKDLALAKKKFDEYKANKSIYVVGSEQELNFKQLFKLLELNGFSKAKNCYHLSYGLVMLASGKMSSREGSVILFDDLYKNTYDHALNQVKQRHTDWSAKKHEETAKIVVLAALKYPMVMQEPHKKIVFDIAKALDFEGETGPYILYTYARLCSLLRKYAKKIPTKIDYTKLESEQEYSLLKLLEKEQEVIEQAAQKYRPALVARFVMEIAQAANSFYHALPILKADEEIKKARLLLALKVRDVIGRLLDLLGIPVLEEM